jgi:phosphatidylglycerophosphatase C
MSNNTTKIAVFDFDGTIYKGDATKDFCWYFYRKKPLRSYYLLVQLTYWLLWRLKLLTTTQFKSTFIQFLNRANDEQITGLLNSFWEEKKSLVHANLVLEISRLKKDGAHVVVVSASPELFIKTFCLSLGVDTVLGSELKVLNNKYSLLVNCRGQEKLKRIKRDFTDFEIIAAYSDNEDDDVLLNMAKNGHWVDKKGKLIPFLQK